MADDDKATASDDQSGQSPEGAASNEPDPQKVIEDLRKRQSGADKAREAALAERDALQARYDALLSGKSGQQDQSGTKDEATIRAEVQREYEAKLAEAQKVAQTDALNAKFPEARKRYPEITDAAKLAELETLFAETPEPPKPVGNNPQRGTGGQKNIEDMSVAELRAELDKQAATALKRE